MWPRRDRPTIAVEMLIEAGREHTLRRTLGLLAALAALAIAGPGAAEAATVTVASGTTQGGDPYYYIFYDAAAGENNDLQVEDAGGDIVFDDVVPVSGDCSQGKPGAPGDTTARTCSTAGLTGTLVHVLDGVNDVDARGTAQDLLITGTGAQANVLHGGSGDDEIVGWDNEDELFGHGGEDRLAGREGADHLDGGIAADLLEGEKGSDTLVGGSNGGDEMSGGDGVDTADYSARVFGVTVRLDDAPNDGADGEGDNVLSDVENIVGTSFGDTLVAQQGNVVNALLGGNGEDALSGGGGNDLTLSGGEHNDDIYGGPGNDGIYGGSGEDDLSGETGNDSVFGEASNDILHAGPGTDVQLGGAGEDTISYALAATRISVDLDGVADDGADGENDRVGADVERIIGGVASDLLVGNDVANVIRGGDGNDEIIGNGGSDELFGDNDIDTLRTADGTADEVDCGPDGDSYEADSLDTLTGCELNLVVANEPPQPQPAEPGQTTEPVQPGIGPRLQIRPLRLRLSRRGVARLRVQCPPDASERCFGTLRLKRGARTLGKRRFSIAAGSAGSVTVRLSRAARRAIAPKGLRVRAVASARDAASVARVSERRLRILPARG